MIKQHKLQQLEQNILQTSKYKHLYIANGRMPIEYAFKVLLRELSRDN
eukprot:UN05077